jgi:cytochrome b561
MPDTEVKMPKGYSSAQIALHWIIALLITSQFLFNEPMAEAFESALEGELQPFGWAVWAHIAGGIAILALALWRVALRRSRGAPPPQASWSLVLPRWRSVARRTAEARRHGAPSSRSSYHRRLRGLAARGEPLRN